MATEDRKEEPKDKMSKLYDRGKKGKEGSKQEERTEPKAEAMAEGDAPAKPPENIHARHAKAREDLHKKHRGERRDLHGNHKNEHDQMHERHMQEHDALTTAQGAEAQAMPNPGSEPGGNAPIAPGATAAAVAPPMPAAA